MRKCIWCKGTGSIFLTKRGRVTCFNCKGSGQGLDGGRDISYRTNLYLTGNEFAKIGNEHRNVNN